MQTDIQNVKQAYRHTDIQTYRMSIRQDIPMSGGDLPVPVGKGPTSLWVRLILHYIAADPLHVTGTQVFLSEVIFIFLLPHLGHVILGTSLAL